MTYRSDKVEEEKRKQLAELCKLWHESDTWEEFMVKTAVYGKMSWWQCLLLWACLQKKEHKRLWNIGEPVLFAIPSFVAAIACNTMMFWLCGIVGSLLYVPWLVAVDKMEAAIKHSMPTAI